MNLLIIKIGIATFAMFFTAIVRLSKPRRVPTAMGYAVVVIVAALWGIWVGNLQILTQYHLLR